MYSLSSTHTRAGILWVMSELLTVIAVIPIYFQWMASEDRKTAREDARLDAEAARLAAETTGLSGRAAAPQAGWGDFRPSAS